MSDPKKVPGWMEDVAEADAAEEQRLMDEAIERRYRQEQEYDARFDGPEEP